MVVRILNENNILLSSKTIELSEYKTYLELLDRVCFFDYPNLNGVELPSDTAEEKSKTLIDMPVKAKYIVNENNEPDLGGHEAYIDSDGDISFSTIPIGTHTDVYIADDTIEVDGEVRTLPCLFAKLKIWLENKNMVAAVKRLYSEGKLHNSWELVYDEYLFSNGVKKLIEYTYSGNVLLGESVIPAYGSSAKILSLSSTDKSNQLLIAESLSKDLMVSKSDNSDININSNEIKKEDEKDLKDVENKVANTADETEANTLPTEVRSDESANVENSDINSVKPTESGEPTFGTAQDATTDNNSEENKSEPVSVENTEDDANEDDFETATESEETANSSKETSALTEHDLWERITKACRTKLDQWCYITWWYPAISEVWCHYENSKKETDVVRFTYEVINDTVIVSEPAYVELTVSIAEINTTLTKLKTDIAMKDSAIITLNTKINEISEENASLRPYKEMVEKAESDRIEKELSEKKKELRQTLIDTNTLTSEEIEASDEIKAMISSLDEQGIKSIIADKVISSLNENKKPEKEKKTEAATAKQPVVKTNIVDSGSSITSGNKLTPTEFGRAFIRGV